MRYPVWLLLVFLLPFMAGCQTGELLEQEMTAVPPLPTVALPSPQATVISSPTAVSAPPTAVSSPTPLPQTGDDGLPVEGDQQFPDLPPFRLEAIRSEDEVELTWPGTGSDLIIEYLVYRRPDGETEWSEVGRVPVEGPNEGPFTFIDPLPEEWDALAYAVTGRNLYGAESDFSPIALVQNQPD